MCRPPFADNQQISLLEVMYKCLAEDLIQQHVKPVVTYPVLNKPPKTISDKFTENGTIPFIQWNKSRKKYIDQAFVLIPYTKKLVSQCMALDKQGWLGYYGRVDVWLRNLMEKHPIKGKRIAIYGSRSPWYEAMCLNRGAVPYVIEFESPICEDNRIKVMTHQEVEDTEMQFDFALSISSIEHAGFPHYGGAIDHKADIESMKFVRKHLKKNGKFFFSVPLGLDKIVWPVNRVYGEKRFSKLIKGWKIIDAEGFDRDAVFKRDGAGFHSVLVLEKTIF